jgi:uncharacterized membrane protein YvlD (DUF360 family)
VRRHWVVRGLAVLLTTAVALLIANALLPGIEVDGILTGTIATLIVSAVAATVTGLFSLDDDKLLPTLTLGGPRPRHRSTDGPSLSRGTG